MKIVLLLSLVLAQSIVYGKFRVATYNIRNFDYDSRSNTPTNKLHLVDTIKEMNVDLMAIQEINDTEEFKRMIHDEFAGKYEAILSKCGGSHQQRLGFVYRADKLKLLHFKEDLRTVSFNHQQRHTACGNGSRPLAIADFMRKDNGEKVTAISVHLKFGGRAGNIDKRFKQIAIINLVVESLYKQGDKNILIMGDFNSTEYILKNNNYRKFVQSVEEMKLIDSTKDIPCSSYWWGGLRDSKQYPSALDHILISGNMNKGKVRSKVYGHCQKLQCKITPENQMGVSFDEVSDHCPVLTELE